MIEKQPFGRTGHTSTRTIFGAAALGAISQPQADQALELLLKSGVNHIDTAASYGDAELRIGPWMAEHRRDFFLATKTGERTYQKARDGIHLSLERLRVDQVDLLQLHNLVDPRDWETALGPGGALEAAIEARDQGLTRYIGVTGHGVTAPIMHRRSLERFDFDSVLMPYNYPMMQNAEYAAAFDSLLAVQAAQRSCADHQVADATSLGRQARSTATWYEPLTDQADIDRAVHWVLGRPGIFLNTSSDVGILPMLLGAAARFTAQPSDEEMLKAAHELQMEPLFT